MSNQTVDLSIIFKNKVSSIELDTIKQTLIEYGLENTQIHERQIKNSGSLNHLGVAPDVILEAIDFLLNKIPLIILLLNTKFPTTKINMKMGNIGMEFSGKHLSIEKLRKQAEDSIEELKKIYDTQNEMTTNVFTHETVEQVPFEIEVTRV